jgi:hypothetical protein
MRDITVRPVSGILPTSDQTMSQIGIVQTKSEFHASTARTEPT